MRLVQNVAVRVFARPEEDGGAIRTALVGLFPFSFTDEKVQLQESHATGFGNTQISIFSVTVTKESLVRRFVDFLIERLSADQRRLLWAQRASRLDEDLCFFMRFDKAALLKQGSLMLTDGGDCFHVRLGIASYPHNRAVAEVVVGKILKQDATEAIHGANN